MRTPEAHTAIITQAGTTGEGAERRVKLHADATTPFTVKPCRECGNNPCVYPCAPTP